MVYPRIEGDTLSIYPFRSETFHELEFSVSPSIVRYIQRRRRVFLSVYACTHTHTHRMEFEDNNWSRVCDASNDLAVARLWQVARDMYWSLPRCARIRETIVSLLRCDCHASWFVEGKRSGLVKPWNSKAN